MFAARQTIEPAACANLIRDSRRIAVLTGAGISTAAGIPDFRGPKGLYVTRQYDPEAVFEIEAFRRNPKPFYDFSRDFLAVADGIQPTVTHRFLAELEQRGHEVTVVTQNIDPLHTRAGSKNVIFLHGSYACSHCLTCRKPVDYASLCARMKSEPAPRCACGGLIKPDIVFFGESVSKMPRAVRAVVESDLLLVLGSSLAVYPAAMLPHEAGGVVVIVNHGEVSFPAGPKAFFAETYLDPFFSEVAQCLA